MKQQKTVETIETLQAKLNVAIEALHQYALPDSWGETSSFGNKIRNRFLVKGFGGAIAVFALAELGIEIDLPDEDPPPSEIRQKLDDLIEVSQASDWKPGWVYHRAVEQGFVVDMNREDWRYLAEKLNYTPGWAYNKHQEHSQSTVS